MQIRFVIPGKLEIILPPLLFLLAVWLLPFFYEERQETNIFRNDYYLTWITGACCWVSVATRIRINGRHFFPLILVLVYLILNAWFGKIKDEQSQYVVITIISLLGIWRWLAVRSSFQLQRVIMFGMIVVLGFQLLLGSIQGLQQQGNSLSIRGQFHNSGYFANYLAAWIPFLMVAGWKSATSWESLVYKILWFVSLILLMYTMARAAIIGAGIAMGIALFMMNHNRRKLWVRSVRLVLLFCLVGIFAGLWYLKPVSAKGRLTIYQVSAGIFMDHPITGVGPNRFAAYYNHYQAQYFSKGQTAISSQITADNTCEGFNWILQLLVEYGLVGLVILVWLGRLITLKLKREKHRMNPQKMGAVLSILAVLIAGLFSNPFHQLPLIWTLLVHAAILFPVPDNTEPSRKSHPVFMLFIFLGLLTFHFVFTKIRAEKSWYRVSQAALYKSFEESDREYSRLLRVLGNNGDFLYNYGAEASLHGEYLLAITLLKRAKLRLTNSYLAVFLGNSYAAMGEYKLAEENYLTAIHMVPAQLYPKYQLIGLYRKTGRKNLERYWTRLALDYPVKVEGDLVKEMLRFLKDNKQISAGIGRD